MKLFFYFILLLSLPCAIIGQTGICKVLVKVTHKAAPHGISDSLINQSKKHQQYLLAQTQGTGFLYKAENQSLQENNNQFYIITCNHVIERGIAGSILVIFPDSPQDTFYMTQWAADTYFDIAILKFKKPLVSLSDRFYYPFGEVPDQIGGVFVLNTANLIDPLICKRTTASTSFSLSHYHIYTESQFLPGMSGSPLLKNGIVTGIFQGGETHQGVVLKGEIVAYAIQSLLNCPPDIIRGRHIERGFLGLVLRENIQGVYIHQVIPNSVAAVALKQSIPSTQILTINGHLINSILEARFLIEQFTAKQHITITFSSGQSIEFHTDYLTHSNLEKIALHYFSHNTELSIIPHNKQNEYPLGYITSPSSATPIVYLREPYSNYSYIVNKISLLGIMVKIHSDKNNHIVLLNEAFAPIPFKWHTDILPTLYF